MTASMRLLVGYDAGHGGPDDRGTHIPDGPCEADWTLSQGYWTELAIRDLGIPVRVVRIRPYDQALGLEERGRLALAPPCDLVLSSHVNAGPLSLHGMSCFVLPGDPVAMRVAEAIVAARPSELIGTARKIVTIKHRRGHWTRDARAVLMAYAGLTCVLVENGFAVTDARHLLDRKIQQAIAKAHAAGVMAYYQGVCHE